MYVFTGQGSQSSRRLRVLDHRNRQRQSQAEDYPLRRMIKGQAIHQRYMDMTYDTMNEDGNVKTLPLFGDINVRMPKYTFSHSTGFLFAT